MARTALKGHFPVPWAPLGKTPVLGQLTDTTWTPSSNNTELRCITVPYRNVSPDTQSEGTLPLLPNTSAIASSKAVTLPILSCIAGCAASPFCNLNTIWRKYRRWPL